MNQVLYGFSIKLLNYGLNYAMSKLAQEVKRCMQILTALNDSSLCHSVMAMKFLKMDSDLDGWLVIFAALKSC